MSDASACPSDEAIVTLLTQPEHAQASAVLRHLETCSDCRRVTAEAARQLTAQSGDAAAATFAIGEVVGGRYRLDRFVAAGGMGEVYAATDLVAGGTVALKTIACTRVDDPRALRRFHREVAAAAAIQHANVCPVLDFGVHEHAPGGARERLPFLVMRLLTGHTLAQEADRRGPLAVPFCLQIVDQVTCALEAIHAAGVVHRDLKCENVFLTSVEPPFAVVTDFGLARSQPPDGRSRSTSTVSILGTLEYMAPEQVERGDVGAAADIYAVGIMLFKLLTGRFPFPGESPIERTVARLVRRPYRLSVYRDVPPALDALVDRCLARDPRDRPGDARAVRAALGALR